MYPSDDRYALIIAGLEDGYYEVDLAGNFIFYNFAMQNMLGYNESEMTGMNNRSFMSKKTAKKAYETFNRVYESGNGEKAFDWDLIR